MKDNPNKAKMSRIPIHSLLNPSESCKSISNVPSNYRDLSTFNKERAKVITTFQEMFYSMLENNDDYNKIESLIRNFQPKLTWSHKCESLTFKQKAYLTAIIQKSIKSLLVLLKEKGKMREIEFSRKEVRKINKYRQSSKNFESVNIKILTQDLMHSNNNEFKKGKRFPKSHIQLLENWYSMNRRNPYLAENDLAYISKNTTLTKTQIKNWLANRRRKDKITEVSSDIRNILN